MNVDQFHLNKLYDFCGDKAWEAIKIINTNQNPKNIHLDLMNFIQGIYWEGFGYGKKKIRENLEDFVNKIIDKIMEE